VGLYCEASLFPGWGHLYVSRIDVVDETVIIDFLDYRDRLDISNYRHVLSYPTLPRGLQAAQATATYAEIILTEGGW
jgi:hypothetical protein